MVRSALKNAIIGLTICQLKFYRIHMAINDQFSFLKKSCFPTKKKKTHKGCLLPVKSQNKDFSSPICTNPIAQYFFFFLSYQSTFRQTVYFLCQSSKGREEDSKIHICKPLPIDDHTQQRRRQRFALVRLDETRRTGPYSIARLHPRI